MNIFLRSVGKIAPAVRTSSRSLRVTSSRLDAFDIRRAKNGLGMETRANEGFVWAGFDSFKIRRISESSLPITTRLSHVVVLLRTYIYIPVSS